LNPPEAAVPLTPQAPAFEFRPIVCPICAVDDTLTLGERGGTSHRYGYGVATRIVQCRRCTLVFPNPFPFPLDAAELYGDPEKYFASHDSAEKLANGRRFYGDMLRRTGLVNPRMLDVGSGQGELLQAAALEGATQVLGLELSPAMAEYARRTYGIEVLTLTVEDYAAAHPETWDLVVLNAVLEHVHDPDSTIRTISALLKPGAWLFLDVPREPNLLTTVGNALNRLLGRTAVYNLSPTWIPFHVFGFNERSLARLLEKHGLEMVEFEVWANPDFGSGKGLKDKVKTWIAGLITRIANLTGTSSNMTVWCRKR
jgi:SAM-dependent methyltransferase